MKGKKGFQKEYLNPEWKGDGVGYHALHAWVKRHLVKPERCEECRKKKKLDLANISQKYLRVLIDWRWLCRRCHMISDGRLEKFKKARMGMKPSRGFQKGNYYGK